MSKYLLLLQIFKINKPAAPLAPCQNAEKTNSYCYNKNTDLINILFYWLAIKWYYSYFLLCYLLKATTEEK